MSAEARKARHQTHRTSGAPRLRGLARRMLNAARVWPVKNPLQWEGDARGRQMSSHGKNESAIARSVWDIRLMFSPRNQTTNNAVRAAASVTDADDAPARIQNKVGETLAHGTSQRWHGSPFWPLY